MKRKNGREVGGSHKVGANEGGTVGENVGGKVGGYVGGKEEEKRRVGGMWSGQQSKPRKGSIIINSYYTLWLTHFCALKLISFLYHACLLAFSVTC